MKILIINGPNINMLGIREKEIYGENSYEELLKNLNIYAKKLNLNIEEKQSNSEGDIVNFIQYAYFSKFDGIVINPAAYTHTSIAILDALKATNLPTVEVHISSIQKREDFRKISYIKNYVIKSISGKGIIGYYDALVYLKNYLRTKNEKK